MIPRLTPLAFAVTLGLAAGAAAAAPSYPRSVVNGENATVLHGPAPGNVVGGGRVRADGTGETWVIEHLDPVTQAPRAAAVPGWRTGYLSSPLMTRMDMGG